MSKAEILLELPKLELAERREIFACICDMEERDLLNGSLPTAEEKILLDRELEAYRQDPDVGSTWAEVQARLRK